MEDDNRGPQCSENAAFLGEHVASDDEMYDALLRRTASMKPDPEVYDYVGSVEFEPQAVAAARIDEAERGLITAIDKEKSVAEDEEEDPVAERGVLVSADGRVFEEKASTSKLQQPILERRFTYISKLSDTQEVRDIERESASELGGSGTVRAEGGAGTDLLGNVAPAGNVIGTDGRQLQTSSAYPWRAVGVALTSPTSSFVRGSGCMVGPRHCLTAAHVISGNGSVSSLAPVRVAPAARGEGYSGNRWPFGQRFVQWYYWPKGWNGSLSLTKIRYDYALLVLEDLGSSPGWIRFGYQTATWLDFKRFNTAGYPGADYQCKASPLGTGKCGGYMYTQYERVTSVLPGYFYNKFDVNKGQSGSPVYWRNGDTRISYGIIVAAGSLSNVACRIRKGNFGSICSWIKNWPSSYFNNVTC